MIAILQATEISLLFKTVVQLIKFKFGLLIKEKFEVDSLISSNCIYLYFVFKPYYLQSIT